MTRAAPTSRAGGAPHVDNLPVKLFGFRRRCHPQFAGQRLTQALILLERFDHRPVGDSLAVGQTAEIELDAFSQETFTGKVTRVAPVVSTKTRVVPIMLEVPNPDNRIKAGISGFARVKCSKSGATAIPSVAVIKKQRKAMVFCVEEGRSKIREIQTGEIVGTGEVQIPDWARDNGSKSTDPSTARFALRSG